MKLDSLTAQVRAADGKGAARRLREQGLIPAILYGGQVEPISLELNLREFERLLHRHTGHHAIVQLEIQDKPELNCPALIKAVDRHPVRDVIIHADFQRIRLDQRITVLVPIVLKGRARGAAEGGIIDHQLRELEIECPALEVPEQIEVEVTELGIGDSLHVSDVAAPFRATIRTPQDRTVVAVYAPRLARVAEEAAAEAPEVAPGPEVVEKGKEEREE